MENKQYPQSCYNKDGSLIDPGEGYRLLELAEPLENRDSKYVKGEWREFHEMDLGAPVWRFDPPIRRKIKAPYFWDQETDKIHFIDPVTNLKYEVFTRTYKDIKSANEDQYQMLQVGWFGLAHPSVECIVTYKRRA